VKSKSSHVPIKKTPSGFFGSIQHLPSAFKVRVSEKHVPGNNLEDNYENESNILR